MVKLCYVDPPWAYFTEKPLKEAWGDDWDDAPYEHNAGLPYDYVLKVAYDADLSTPSDGKINSEYSVDDINRGAVAWLIDRWGRSGVIIPAGTTIIDFVSLIKKAGGTVYEASITGPADEPAGDVE